MAPVLGGSEKCPRCNQSVYFAEEVRAMGKKYHKLCLKCVECSKTLDSSSCNDHEDNIYCNSCYRKTVHSAALSMAQDTGEPLESNNASTTGDCCFRCGKTVYMAERVAGGENYFHKRCFRCLECSSMLDSARLCVREGEIYCKACYSKNFGPKGYGFAGGAGGLSMDTGKVDEIVTSHIPATAQAHTAPLNDDCTEEVEEEDWTDNKDRCNRCRKVVYFAERVSGVGQIYHKACFKCSNGSCNKALDSTTVTEHDGKIYCKACYGRNFGPKGFGYGTSLVSEQA